MAYDRSSIIAKLENDLAQAREALERMKLHPEFHSEDDIAFKRAEVTALEDVIRLVKGDES